MERRTGNFTAASPGLLLVIAYLGFISLGLPDTVIGVAWPSVRDTFNRHQSEIALIFAGNGVSYFLSSFFTGRLLNWFGVGTLLAASSALVAASAIGFGLSPVWILFALLPVLHGLGSGAIDAGLNHYVANHFSARQMNWLHACYSLGATLGPFIMTAVIASHASWRSGYLIVGGILVLLTVLFASTRRRWNDPQKNSPADPSPEKSRAWDVLNNRTVWLQIAFFFLYAGIESTVGQWSFTILTESRAVPIGTAGSWVTSYWGSIALGRVVFGFLVDRIGIDRLLRASLLTTLIGAVWFALNLRFSSMALPLIGLGLAPLYPCMMTRTPQRLGKSAAAHAIGFQVSAAMLGVASLPGACGFLAQQFSPATVPFAAAGMVAGILALHELLLRNDVSACGRRPPAAADSCGRGG